MIISEPIRFRYEEAYRKFQHKAYPSATSNFGYLTTKYPDTRTKGGLATFVCNFLKWNGHHGEKTNNMGRPIQKFAPKMNIWTGTVQNVPNGIEWQKGSGITGTSDVKGHVNIPASKFPVPIYVEIKIGKDRQSQEQKGYQKQVTDTGAFYMLCSFPEDFILFYDYLLTLQ